MTPTQIKKHLAHHKRYLAGKESYPANFSHRDLSGVDFSNLDLREARFNYATLTNANFSNARLDCARFAGVNATATYFGGARLYYATFADADLIGARFDAANLANAIFTRANLDTTRFEDACLRDAYFSDTQITRTTDFFDADLTGFKPLYADTRRGYIIRFIPHALDAPRFVAGCRTFTYKEALEHWGPGPRHQPEYVRAIKRWWREWKKHESK